jgi:hypothetical protein
MISKITLSCLLLTFSAPTSPTSFTDKFLLASSITALCASPFLTYWSFCHWRQHNQAREALEQQNPQLTWMLKLADVHAKAREKELGPDWSVWVNKSAVYQTALNPESAECQQLVMHLQKEKLFVTATFIASFLGIAALKLLHTLRTKKMIQCLRDNASILCGRLDGSHPRIFCNHVDEDLW